MRVSFMQLFKQGVSIMQDTQAELNKTQLQVSTGRRILSAADDPVAAARILDLNGAIEQNEQFQRNANLVSNRLAYEEQVVSDVESAMLRVRDLVVQANNDTQTPETRGYLAVEAGVILDQLVQVANTRDGEGNYLFGGFQSATQPYVRDGNAVVYQGDQGRRMIRISETRQIADGDPGAFVFDRIRNGNGTFTTSAASANTGTGIADGGSVTDPSQWDKGDYTIRFVTPDSYEVLDGGGAVVASGPYQDGQNVAFRGISFGITGSPAAGDEFAVGASRNQSIFATVQNVIDSLASASGGPAAAASLHNGLNRALADVDQSIDSLLATRTDIGSRRQAVEAQTNSNEDLGLTLQQSLAELQELDYAEAITRLNQQITGLEAAQQSFVRVQGLSLFRLLG